MATKAQQAHALASHFAKAYEKQFGRKYKGNTHREKWGFQDMLEDLDMDEAKRVVDWYFGTSRAEFTAADLHKNYDKLVEAMQDYEEEKKAHDEALERTRRKVEEFRRMRGLD